MRAPLAAAFLAALLFAPVPARAAGWEVDFLGPAREVSHSSSASRDTAALQLIVYPHRVLTGGGDFGVFKLKGPQITVRLGVFAMMELESEGKTTSFDGMPAADIHFWRGVWGYSVALAFDELAARWLGPRGALELTVSGRHESEHYTGSNEGGSAINYGDRPHIGNFVMWDLAVRVPAGRFDLIARFQHKVFLLDGGGYKNGPGGDLVVRWRLWRWVHPFTSFFGEYLFAIAPFPDAYLFRNLTGIMVPSKAGDIQVFLSADVGHRKGLAVYTEERTIGGGIRFSFF